jgi:chitinase
VIGYATGWNPAQAKDLDKIDTLIFAFAKVEDGRVVLGDHAAQKLQALVALKRRDPTLKVDVVFTSQNYHDYHDPFMGPVDMK